MISILFFSLFTNAIFLENEVVIIRHSINNNYNTSSPINSDETSSHIYSNLREVSLDNPSSELILDKKEQTNIDSTSQEEISSFKLNLQSQNKLTDQPEITTQVHPTSGDWVINSDTTVSDENITLNGNLIIEQNTNVAFNNVSIFMNNSISSNYQVIVNDNSNLEIGGNSSLQANQPTHHFNITGSETSSITINNSRVFDLDYGILTNGSLTIDSSRIENALKFGVLTFDTSLLHINNSQIITNEYGIVSVNSTNVVLSENDFISNSTGVLYIEGNDNTIISRNNVTIESNYAGRNINLLDSQNIQFIDNLITTSNTSSSGPFYIENTTNSTFSQNRIKGSTEVTSSSYALMYVSGSSDLEFSFNNFTSYGFGIILLESNNNTIFENQFLSNSNSAADTLAFYFSENNIIKNNNFRLQNRGIFSFDSDEISIENNNLTNFASVSIELYQSSNFSIKLNKLEQSNDTSEFEGITITNSITGLISNNFINSTSNSVKLLNSEKISISNNSIFIYALNSGKAFSVINSQFILSLNNISSSLNSLDTVDIQQSFNSTIIGNEISQASTYFESSVIISQGYNITIAENNINSLAGHTLEIRNSDEINVLYNTIQNLSVANAISLWIYNSEDTTILYNDIDNFDYRGLEINYASDTTIYNNTINGAANSITSAIVFNSINLNITLNNFVSINGEALVFINSTDSQIIMNILVSQSDSALAATLEIYNKSNNNMVVDNEIFSSESRAIYLNDVQEIQLEDNTFTGRIGMYLTSSINLILINNLVTNSNQSTSTLSETGVYLSNNTQLSMENNIIKSGDNNNSRALSIRESNGLNIGNNQLISGQEMDLNSTNMVGIDIENSSNISIYQNDISSGFGIYSDAISVINGTNVHFLDNSINSRSSQSSYASYLVNSTNIEYTGNIFYKSQGSMIYDINSVNSTYTSNTIEFTMFNNDVVFYFNGSSEYSIQNNSIDGSSYTSGTIFRLINNDNGLIERNIINELTQNIISLEGLNNTNNVVYKNNYLPEIIVGFPYFATNLLSLGDEIEYNTVVSVSPETDTSLMYQWNQNGLEPLTSGSLIVDNHQYNSLEIVGNDNNDNKYIISSEFNITEDISPVFLTSPGNQVISLGETLVLNWTVSEDNPTIYQIYMNDSIVDSDTYSSIQLISNTQSGLDTGIYNFTIIVFDQFENYSSDTVMVEVIDNNPIDTSDIASNLPEDGFPIIPVLIILIVTIGATGYIVYLKRYKNKSN